MRGKSRSQGAEEATTDDGPSYWPGLPFSRTAQRETAKLAAREAKSLEIAPESDDLGGDHDEAAELENPLPALSRGEAVPFPPRVRRLPA